LGQTTIYYAASDQRARSRRRRPGSSDLNFDLLTSTHNPEHRRCVSKWHATYVHDPTHEKFFMTNFRRRTADSTSATTADGLSCHKVKWRLLDQPTETAPAAAAMAVAPPGVFFCPERGCGAVTGEAGPSSAPSKCRYPRLTTRVSPASQMRAPIILTTQNSLARIAAALPQRTILSNRAPASTAWRGRRPNVNSVV
jgi:hypothetical protein